MSTQEWLYVYGRPILMIVGTLFFFITYKFIIHTLKEGGTLKDKKKKK